MILGTLCRRQRVWMCRRASAQLDRIRWSPAVLGEQDPLCISIHAKDTPLSTPSFPMGGPFEATRRIDLTALPQWWRTCRTGRYSRGPDVLMAKDRDLSSWRSRLRHTYPNFVVSRLGLRRAIDCGCSGFRVCLALGQASHACFGSMKPTRPARGPASSRLNTTSKDFQPIISSQIYPNPSVPRQRGVFLSPIGHLDGRRYLIGTPTEPKFTTSCSGVCVCVSACVYVPRSSFFLFLA